MLHKNAILCNNLIKAIQKMQNKAKKYKFYVLLTNDRLLYHIYANGATTFE